MKSRLTDGLSGGVEGKTGEQTVHTDRMDFVKDPTSNRTSNVVSNQTEPNQSEVVICVL